MLLQMEFHGLCVQSAGRSEWGKECCPEKKKKVKIQDSSLDFWCKYIL